jgi:starch phosphorylase
VDTSGEQHIIVVEVFLKDVSPDSIRVEVYADALKGGSTVHQEMTRLRQLPGEAGGYLFSATVSSSRSANDYTARITPRFEGVSLPLEAGWILWQK